MAPLGLKIGYEKGNVRVLVVDLVTREPLERVTEGPNLTYDPSFAKT